MGNLPFKIALPVAHRLENVNVLNVTLVVLLGAAIYAGDRFQQLLCLSRLWPLAELGDELLQGVNSHGKDLLLLALHALVLVGFATT